MIMIEKHVDNKLYFSHTYFLLHLQNSNRKKEVTSMP